MSSYTVVASLHIQFYNVSKASTCDFMDGFNFKSLFFLVFSPNYITFLVTLHHWQSFHKFKSFVRLESMKYATRKIFYVCQYI